MKYEDRIQALKRSSKYRKDYKKYEDYLKKKGIIDYSLIDIITPIFKLSSEGHKLCKKYKILYPFNPDNPPKNGTDTAKISMPAVFPLPLRVKRSGEHFFGLEDARFLNVKIDISRTLSDIQKDIKTLYHSYSKQIKVPKRNRDLDLPKGKTIWDIYDMRKQGKTILQITKDIFRITESPSNDAIAKSKYRIIERAYNKAKKLIKEAEG
jgi:hypothetical protein